jgi:hypothetical protein
MANDGAQVGRSVVAYYSLNQDMAVIPNDFKRLGAVRDKSYGTTWDTVDATSDDSPNLTKENLVVFKSSDGSFSGVYRTEEARSINELDTYIKNPANDQPFGWVMIAEPIGSGQFRNIYIPVIFSDLQKSAPYSDVATWDLSYMSNGATQEEIV